MADRVISNPIINSPYRAPTRHFAFDNEGITDRIVEGRRESSYFVPVPRPRKRAAQQQLELGELTADQIEKNHFVNEIRARVGRWREAGYPDVTAVTRRLLEYWTDPGRDNPVLFCQLEAAETAIYLAEAAQKAGDTWIRNELERQNEEHNARLNRIGLKMATGTGKTVVMAMLIAWQTLNKAASPNDARFARRFLIVTPGLTIRDRLRVLRPEHDENYYKLRDLVPADLEPRSGPGADRDHELSRAAAAGDQAGPGHREDDQRAAGRVLGRPEPVPGVTGPDGQPGVPRPWRHLRDRGLQRRGSPLLPGPRRRCGQRRSRQDAEH